MFIVIDYLQLLQGSSSALDENRVQEITEITTRLKALAKELNVPILALSQLSRAVEPREDKRPQLSDLRESGSIEQDADVVLFVFRDAYYLKNAEPRDQNSSEYTGEWLAKYEKVKFQAEVIIGKQRHGPTGTRPRTATRPRRTLTRPFRRSPARTSWASHAGAAWRSTNAPGWPS